QMLFPLRVGLPGDPQVEPKPLINILKTALHWMKDAFSGKLPMQVLRKPFFPGEELDELLYASGSFSSLYAQHAIRHAMEAVSLSQEKEIPAPPSWWPLSIGLVGWRTFFTLSKICFRILPFFDQLHRDDDAHTAQQLIRGLEEVRQKIQDWAAYYLQDHDFLRVFFEACELILASCVGIVRDKIWKHGWDVIDHLEWMDWLEQHGAPRTLQDTIPMRAMYHFSFAFPLGKTDRPRASAAVMMRILTRLWFDYRGAVLYKMQGGMGDVVFAPLFEVLKHRGVRFRFFSKVKALLPSKHGRFVDQIVIGKQVQLLETSEDAGQVQLQKASEHAKPDTRTTLPYNTYQPLFSVRGQPCWPSEPLWSQIQDGAKIAEHLQRTQTHLESYWCDQQVGEDITLRRGIDFDQVISGIPLEALKFVAPALLEQKPAFKTMVYANQSVETAAMQLWMRPTGRSLGWSPTGAVITGERPPFDSMIEMTHLLPHEQWEGEEVPQSLFYFCGVPRSPSRVPLQDLSYPSRKCRMIEHAAQKMLRLWSGRFWSKLSPKSQERTMDWSLLYTAQETSQETHSEEDLEPSKLEPLAQQYIRINADPSERYNIALPGGATTRLATDESGYTNLWLVGDGIRTGMNYGCIESAVISGLQASRSRIGTPNIIPGEHDQVPSPWKIPREVEHKPRFVETVPPQCLISPFAIDHVELYTFLLEASQPGALQAYVDRTLNQPAEGQIEYKVIFNHIVVFMASMQKIYSIPMGEQAGWTPETDAGFWIVMGARTPDQTVFSRVLLYPVAMYVNSTYTLMGGREIFGYPKGFGTVTMPAWPGDPGPFTLRSAVTPSLQQTLVQPQWIWSIRPQQKEFVQKPAWQDPAAFLRAVSGTLAKASSMQWAMPKQQWLPQLFSQAIPMVYLKQFRDAAQPERACYQAIVENQTQMRNFRGGGIMPGSFHFGLYPNASFDLRTPFGLQEQMNVLMACWSRLDMTIQDANRTWELS
ncbi:MAG: hypothetical protein AAGJ35_01810, partial [Myxococcota bacterium]